MCVGGGRRAKGCTRLCVHAAGGATANQSSPGRTPARTHGARASTPMASKVHNLLLLWRGGGDGFKSTQPSSSLARRRRQRASAFCCSCGRSPGQKRAIDLFGWVFFLISPAHLHVPRAHKGRACRRAGETALTPIRGGIERLATRTSCRLTASLERIRAFNYS